MGYGLQGLRIFGVFADINRISVFCRVHIIKLHDSRMHLTGAEIAADIWNRRKLQKLYTNFI